MDVPFVFDTLGAIMLFPGAGTLPFRLICHFNQSVICPRKAAMR